MRDSELAICRHHHAGHILQVGVQLFDLLSLLCFCDWHRLNPLDLFRLRAVPPLPGARPSRQPSRSVTYALAAASIGAVSNKMPGPIVELRVQPLMYLPLATDGLALITLVITTLAFSISFAGVNEILPTGTCTSAVLSVRNSTLPAFTSCTALATSKVTVPVFGLGIRPLGPRIFPKRPTDFITSGVAIRASKSVQFSLVIFSTMSSPPT